MSDLWNNTIGYMKKASKALNLNEEILDALLKCKRVLEFQIPLRMDDGKVRYFTGYRVVHNDALGVSGDGTRIVAGLTADEVKGLALVMSIKHAANGIPAGGAKGGIDADPTLLSEGEFERLVRGYVRGLFPRGAKVDVPGADINTSAKTQAWMLDEYEQITGIHSPGAVNDKPRILGGSLGGEDATGRGMYHLTLKICEEQDWAPEDVKVAIQGFGNVGSHYAKYLQSAGFKVVAVSDIKGGIFNPDGINIEDLLKYSRMTGSVVSFPDARQITNEEILLCDCDILAPSAVEDVITLRNAGDIKAKIIIEGANGPITPQADDVLYSRGIIVVPDVVANAGSAIVCHFERSQCATDYYWDLETVQAKLESQIINSYVSMKNTAKELHISFRTAAWVNALKAIVKAMKLRGLL
ncbi:glutamate dehydrogenase (NAD(P)+) [Acetomicrobium thermoterrenum DSM 13490]|uniref:Glutamate dehydrogenase n=1 Tax=Acetomicrobium thermoterrenum DSM 13490 TaxID=1120987 RepID=A0A1H3EIJ4_9BACT|nr:Glu/Leu/Phe/Val dehydrogenase [Acetomicrobium thermoterrenum]SDX78582.1 glutamate dehydrogenase (NAD(P)+) [Acetomicrobium thermoterrenum DSM 13490]